MNKKANRRAFFVCAFMCLVGISVMTGLPDRLSPRRLTRDSGGAPQGLAVAPAAPLQEEKEAAPAPATPEVPREGERASGEPVRVADAAPGEPALLIALPLAAYAMKEGFLEKEGLIFVRKEGYNSGGWKKPFDILKEKDVAGLIALSRAIGKTHSLEFLKKEGITCRKVVEPEEIILGKACRVEKEQLLSLCNKYVTDEFSRLLPFHLQGVAVARGKTGFELTRGKEPAVRVPAGDETEWMMPNLTNLPLRAALERLSTHTGKVKVYGSGYIVDQSPKPFERMKGEAECVVYGRTYR